MVSFYNCTARPTSNQIDLILLRSLWQHLSRLSGDLLSIWGEEAGSIRRIETFLEGDKERVSALQPDGKMSNRLMYIKSLWKVLKSQNVTFWLLEIRVLHMHEPPARVRRIIIKWPNSWWGKEMALPLFALKIGVKELDLQTDANDVVTGSNTIHRELGPHQTSSDHIPVLRQGCNCYQSWRLCYLFLILPNSTKVYIYN